MRLPWTQPGRAAVQGRLFSALALLAALAGVEWHLCARPRGPVYLGRPVSHWEREARSWEPCYLEGEYDGCIFWRHRLPRWQKWLGKLGIPLERCSSSCPLLEADPAAVPVLAELLQSPDAGVRLLAADGLGKLGNEARPALPALVGALEDEDERVRLHAEKALHAVDTEAVEQAGG